MGKVSRKISSTALTKGRPNPRVIIKSIQQSLCLIIQLSSISSRSSSAVSCGQVLCQTLVL